MVPPLVCRQSEVGNDVAMCDNESFIVHENLLVRVNQVCILLVDEKTIFVFSQLSSHAHIFKVCSLLLIERKFHGVAGHVSRVALEQNALEVSLNTGVGEA